MLITSWYEILKFKLIKLYLFVRVFSQASLQIQSIEIIKPAQQVSQSIHTSETFAAKDAAESPAESDLGDSLVVHGEDGQLFDARIHKKMRIWLLKKNCAADLETHRLLAPMFSVVIDANNDTDTTNGVAVKLSEEGNPPSNTAAETVNSPPNESAVPVDSQSKEPTQKSTKFKFARRTRSTFSDENK